EQLEELPGVGPKTVEKISIAVTNYFSSLETASAEPGEGAPSPQIDAETQPVVEEAGAAAGEMAEPVSSEKESSAAPEAVARGEGPAAVKDTPNSEAAGGEEPGEQGT